MYKCVTYSVCFFSLLTYLVHKSTSSNFQEAMEQMIEQSQPSEGDEDTTVTMSPLATMRQ